MIVDIILVINALLFLYWTLPYSLILMFLWVAFKVVVAAIIVISKDASLELILFVIGNRGADAAISFFMLLWNFSRNDHQTVAFLFWVVCTWFTFSPRFSHLDKSYIERLNDQQSKDRLGR